MGYPTDEELRERHPVMAAIADANKRDSDDSIDKTQEELQDALAEMKKKKLELELSFEAGQSLTVGAIGDTEKKFDVVEKAEHYNQGGVECIDALRAAGVSDEPGFQAWLRLTCIKYLWRLPHKDKPLEDAKKTRYYLNKLIEELESNG